MKNDDKEILDLIKDESSREKGFILILEKYQKRLYWHIRRFLVNHEDADDVLQNTFIKVWQGLAKFRSESQLFTWLYRIATNESLIFIKKAKRHKAISLEEGGHELAACLDNDPLISGDEISIKLQKAILMLPAKQRLVFNMKYFDELKYTEMSAILGTSVGALKTSYHLAVKKIEKLVLIN